MGSKRRRKTVSKDPVTAVIESISHDGRGVARVDGKAVFVDGALLGEKVVFQYRSSKRKYAEAAVIEVLESSPDRVVPKCPHFGVCGGCALQHMQPEAQIRAKQHILLENLKRIGGVVPKQIEPPMMGPIWGYRRKARLGAKWVIKKQSVLVGFREKGNSYIAELEQCVVLHPLVGQNIMALRALLASLSIANQIPQIEMAMDDQSIALIFRHLEAFSEADLVHLKAFSEQYDFQIYLQSKGPDTIHLLWPEQALLSYVIPDFDIKITFQPNDFTQVNTEINRRMVALAIEWLALKPTDHVLDLFCGLGNFTLPLARRAGKVVGVEGDAGLIERAKKNAENNNINNTTFYTMNLAADVSNEAWFKNQQYDKLLIDPPRSGAADIIPLITKLAPTVLVYVSCNPATLARDAGDLYKAGYELQRAGVMDMFPHTTHVESIALFHKKR
ncbi:MAG: 23S rRNA (uracil(1939)-C(5))-methyltransferase RlmD [Gammaproteobacteria bacterium]|nr:23S rRNA (uracil(1939)-C(5))-methyltransferase RlmD [Gammaproteobacteria bacterium]